MATSMVKFSREFQFVRPNRGCYTFVSYSQPVSQARETWAAVVSQAQCCVCDDQRRKWDLKTKQMLVDHWRSWWVEARLDRLRQLPSRLLGSDSRQGDEASGTASASSELASAIAGMFKNRRGARRRRSKSERSSRKPPGPLTMGSQTRFDGIPIENPGQ